MKIGKTLAGVALAFAILSPAAAQTDVKIGLIAPMSGPWARQGDLMLKGANLRHRGHQQAGGHQGAGRRQAQAHRVRRRRQRRKGEERGSAHDRTGARPGRRDRRVAVELHARRHGGDRARRAAGAHAVRSRPDHRAWLQVRLPDLAHRRPAGQQRGSRIGQARRERDRQEAADGRHHPGQHGRRGRVRQADA